MTDDAGPPAHAVGPGGAWLMLGDRLALAATYDQLFQHAAQCRDESIRNAVTALTPGRAAVAGVVALGGIVAYLSQDNQEPALLRDQFAQIVTAAVGAAIDYPELDA